MKFNNFRTLAILSAIFAAFSSANPVHQTVHNPGEEQFTTSSYAHIRRCPVTVEFPEEDTDRCLATQAGIILTIRYHFCYFLTYRVLVCRDTGRALRKAVRKSKRCIKRGRNGCRRHPNQITCGVELVQQCTDGRFVSDY